MKKIIRYRVVWEEGVNVNYKGDKAIAIETPHFLTARIELEKYNIPFASRRFECDIQEDDEQIETKVLYFESYSPCKGEIRYTAKDLTGEWVVQNESSLDHVRQKSLNYIEKSIKENLEVYDEFKTEQIPCVITTRREQPIDRYKVWNWCEKIKAKYFNGIDEVVSYVQTLPLGVSVAVIDNKLSDYIECYEEGYDDGNCEFYALNTVWTEEYIKGEDGDGPCWHWEDIYGPDPKYFKDLNVLREYALNKLPDRWGDDPWQEDEKWVVWASHFMTEEELKEEEEF